MLGEVLVDNGYAVSTAKDGSIALNNLIHNAEQPDLILLDVLMPIKTGPEFRREQLLIDEISELPVIFMSGNYFETELPCLLKPFDQYYFLNLIKCYLRNK